MKLFGAVVCWLFVLLFDLDCRNATEPPLLLVHDVYATSFESDDDTSGWRGYGGYRIVEDAPDGGGSRSLEVSGGCGVPHAVRTVVVPRAGKKIILAMWGKLMANGGEARLRWSDEAGGGIQISVTDTAWTRYEAGTSIACRAGDTLRLELMSGGFVYGAMRVDRLEVLVADERTGLML